MQCTFQRRVVRVFLACLALLPATCIANDERQPAAQLPTAVDLQPKFLELGLKARRQGRRGTCSVFTTAGAMEFALSVARGEGTPLSVEYLNWSCNQVIHNRADRGQFFHHLLAGFEQHGICLESEMPYTRRFDPELQPSAEAIASAQRIRAAGFEVHWIKRIGGTPGLSPEQLTEVKQVLAGGLPVAAGASHSRLLVGYRDDSTEPGGGVLLTKDSGAGAFRQVTYEFALTELNDVFWIAMADDAAKKEAAQAPAAKKDAQPDDAAKKKAEPPKPEPAPEPPTPEPTAANVAYGPDERNVLDFWQAPGDGPRPLLVYIHGGGWTGGDKKLNAKALEPFLEKGISVASINYRLTGTAALPAPVHDAARAIQFLRTKADEWKINKSRIAVTGTSAGACTSMWLLCHDDLADPQSSDPVLRESTRVSAAAAIAGQVSIDPRVIEPWLGPNVLTHRMIWTSVGEPDMASALANYDAHRAMYAEFSPYNHVDGRDPPLLMTYTNNMKLPSENAGHGIHHGEYGVKMKEKADAAGQECHLLIEGVSASEKYKSVNEFLIDKLLAP